MQTITGRRTLAILSVGLIFGLTILACNFPASPNTALAVTAVSPTQIPIVPTLTPISSSAAIPITGNQATTSATPTATPIVHHTQPGTPPAYGPTLTDVDSSTTASLHYPPTGDIFTYNLFERPFNANAQDTYFPQIDIQKSSMVNGSPWVYGSITLKAVDPNTSQLDAAYALELDLNKDGRGDVLVVANNPAQGNWSTNGVQVFSDSNHDVGENTPLYPDGGTPGNGYDQKVFDSGLGSDPDLAWSMVSPAQPNVVWIAFKSDLTSNASQWMWSAWAQMGGLHPESFDYNDHISQADAGNPLPGNANYPLKALAELDNTCRGAVGFTLTGSEPGACRVAAAPAFTITGTPQPSSTPHSHPSKTPTTAAPTAVNSPTSTPTDWHNADPGYQLATVLAMGTLTPTVFIYQTPCIFNPFGKRCPNR